MPTKPVTTSPDNQRSRIKNRLLGEPIHYNPSQPRRDPSTKSKATARKNTVLAQQANFRIADHPGMTF